MLGTHDENYMQRLSMECKEWSPPRVRFGLNYVDDAPDKLSNYMNVYDDGIKLMKLIIIVVCCTKLDNV